MIKKKWVVSIKGSQTSEHEICIVNQIDFPHGVKSWGWYGEDKLIIRMSNDEDEETPRRVWKRAKEIAEILCRELNSTDGKSPSPALELLLVQNNNDR